MIEVPHNTPQPPHSEVSTVNLKTPSLHQPEIVNPISYTLHPTFYTLHPTPYTLHPTSYTLHPPSYTLHPTHYTLHPTPYIHPTPYTLHPTPSRSPEGRWWAHSALLSSPGGASHPLFLITSPNIPPPFLDRILRYTAPSSWSH